MIFRFLEVGKRKLSLKDTRLFLSKLRSKNLIVEKIQKLTKIAFNSKRKK